MQTHGRYMMTAVFAAEVRHTVRDAQSWLAAASTEREKERSDWIRALERLRSKGFDTRRHEFFRRGDDLVRTTWFVAPEHAGKSSLCYEYREVTEDEYIADCQCFQTIGETLFQIRIRRPLPPALPVAVASPPLTSGVVQFPPKGFYESKHWHDTADATKRAWNYECALNAAHTGPVEAHHRTYARVGKEEERDTIPLCADCHKQFHDRMPQPLLLKKAA